MMEINLVEYKSQLTNATWVDVNPRWGQNNLAERLPDERAVVICSLYNLFNCPIGSRGRIFQPEYGSSLYPFLQEPIDIQTAHAMEVTLIQAVDRWENTRIRIDTGGTYIEPVMSLPGYRVQFSYYFLLNNRRDVVTFTVSV